MNEQLLLGSFVRCLLPEDARKEENLVPRRPSGQRIARPPQTRIPGAASAAVPRGFLSLGGAPLHAFSGNPRQDSLKLQSLYPNHDSN